MDVLGRTAFTTGANSGIGLATAIELARRGWHSVGGVRSPSKARNVHAAAREAGVEVETVILDVTDAAGCRRVIEKLQPYALVNNAAVTNLGAVEDVPDADVRSQIETMVVAPMRLARLALPYMREQGGGRIVNVSSIYGITTTSLSGWYQACKHALEAVSDALRIEVARDGIRVILVQPGGVTTGIWAEGDAALERRRDTRYTTAYARTRRGFDVAKPILSDPVNVARVIANAAAAQRPRARYLVGYDAQLIRLYDGVIPETIRDRLQRLALGL